MAYQNNNCYGCPPVGPTQTAPAQQVVQNVYHPTLVPVVHPINIVKKHHCVPVYQHCTVVTVTDEMANVSSYKSRKSRRKARSK